MASSRPPAFLSSVLDGLVSPVCVLDPRGTIVAVNRAWREFAAANGRSGSVDEGSNYVEICRRALGSAAEGAEDARRFLHLLEDLLAGRHDRFDLEYDGHSPTASRWFVARGSRMAGVEPPHFLVVHDDVSRQMQAQETLGRSEGLLLSLAASIPGTLFRLLRRSSGSWQFIYLSPGVEALFGVPAGQARVDVEALWGRVLPQDRPGFDAALAASLDRDGAWDCTCRIETTTGAIKWIEVKASTQHDADGSTLWTGVMLDVTEHQRLEAGLRASEETYRRLFETVPQGVVQVDRAGHIVSANPAAQRILGLTLDELQGRTSLDPRWNAVHEDGSPFPSEDLPVTVALRSGRSVHDVVMGIARPDGSRAWILVNATPLAAHDGADLQVYATFEDITQRVRLAHELEQQARTDFLTGAANRRGLTDRLGIEFERARRDPHDVFSVLALDLDHFKDVNDHHGHATGDAVLVHVATLMRRASRAIDVVARSGGEEFTLLLPDTGLAAAIARAERLREQIEAEPLRHDGRALPITVSIGVSTVAAADAGIDAVLARADRALYEAKAAGRNTVRARPATLGDAD